MRISFVLRFPEVELLNHNCFLNRSLGCKSRQSRTCRAQGTRGGSGWSSVFLCHSLGPLSQQQPPVFGSVLTTKAEQTYPRKADIPARSLLLLFLFIQLPPSWVPSSAKPPTPSRNTSSSSDPMKTRLNWCFLACASCFFS